MSLDQVTKSQIAWLAEGNEEEAMERRPVRRGISRREFLTRTAGAAVVVGGLPAILAACTGAANTNTQPSGSGGPGGSGGTLGSYP